MKIPVRSKEEIAQAILRHTALELGRALFQANVLRRNGRMLKFRGLTRKEIKGYEKRNDNQSSNVVSSIFDGL